MEIREEKTRFLKGYLVFFAKIERFKEMCNMFPEKQNYYELQIEKTREVIEKIEDSIKKVDDGILSEILFQKYVLGRSLETISYELNYSKRQIERLHIAALEKLKIF